MTIEKTFSNPDQAALDAIKSTDRKNQVLLSNIKYSLIGELRKIGAAKISVDSFEKIDDTYKIKAKFLLKGMKQGEFLFKSVGNMCNYAIRGFDLSIDNATPVEAEYVAPIEMPSERMTFDLSLIQSKDVGDDKCEVIYPTVGVMAVISKVNLDLDTVKKLCTMASEFYGIKSEFVNELKITAVSEEQVFDVNSADKVFEAQREIKSFTKSNTERNENNQFVTLRENFLKSIEAKAANIVKQSKTSYKTGTPKILSVESTMEYIDNKFDGTLIVKAQIGKDIITYGIPVVKNNIFVKGNIDTYKIKREDFVNELDIKLNESIKANLNQEMELMKIEAEKDEKDVADKILGFKVSDVQKVIKVDKNWLPEGFEVGQILNLSGCQYKIEAGSNDTLFNLVLQN
jgi:hypothetical protein